MIARAAAGRFACLDPRERFSARIASAPNGCWLWTGGLDRDGYGRLRVNGARRQVHRWSYEEFVGPIPAGLTIDHLCRNPACVNPAHMEPVTNRENILRGTSPSAVHARKTHCVNGHEFTPDNTHIRPNGSRYCRVCMKRNNDARTARMRDKNDLQGADAGAILDGSVPASAEGA